MPRPELIPSKQQHLRPFEGRVTAHGLLHESFQIDDGERWFRMPKKWTDIRPDIGLYVTIVVTSQNEVVSLKVRSAFRDRVIQKNNEAVYPTD
jgi:hypothetical protein